MAEPDEIDLDLDRLVHEPARLAILTVLSSVQSADFVFIQRITGLTKGNLSSHLSRLEEGGLVRIEKKFVLKKPNTRVELTPEGVRRVNRHWQQLERLRNLSADETKEETAGRSIGRAAGPSVPRSGQRQ